MVYGGRRGRKSAPGWRCGNFVLSRKGTLRLRLSTASQPHHPGAVCYNTYQEHMQEGNRLFLSCRFICVVRRRWGPSGLAKKIRTIMDFDQLHTFLEIVR